MIFVKFEELKKTRYCRYIGITHVLRLLKCVFEKILILWPLFVKNQDISNFMFLV